jgi:hypothetical protein
MLDPHSVARTCPPDQPFDPATIEAIWRAYHAACRTLGLAERHDTLNEIVAQHVIQLAQSGVRGATDLFMLTINEFKDRVR